MQATTTEHVYILGHSDAELERLRLQSDYYALVTDQALRLAGIRPGMRVLDAGCGNGGVSMLISRLVGPTGEVIAIDQSPEATAQAAETIARAGLTNVHFLNEDLATVRLDAPVDAIVGRLILMHVSDPIVVLRNLTANLNKPGIVLFMEMDIGMARTEPPVPIAEALLDLVRSAFERSGVSYRPGMKLYEQFIAAGFPEPQIVSLVRIEPPPAAASSAMLTGVLTSLLPAIEAHGLSTAAELDLPTLPDRIQAAARESGCLVVPPPLICAWSHLG